MNYEHDLSEAFKHDDGESEKVKASKRFRQSLIVARQSAETSGPGKTALDDPAARQQDESLSGRWKLDNFQLNAVRRRVLRDHRAG